MIADRLKVDCIEVCALYNSFSKTVNGWGGGWIQVLHGHKLIRAVELTWQERWEFGQYGPLLPFENPEDYTAKFQRDRFTPVMLDQYCKHFSIDFFNEDFYFPDGKPGYMISDVYQKKILVKTISFEDARSYYGL